MAKKTTFDKKHERLFSDLIESIKGVSPFENAHGIILEFSEQLNAETQLCQKKEIVKRDGKIFIRIVLVPCP